jgi:8-oxo-dGTP pyrophosphatase MutT (NUDIX family)
MISRTEIENFKKKFDIVSVFINHDSETLLLHRQDHKPQGNTWAMVAGKVDENENLLDALIREVSEEVGLVTKSEDFKYFEKYYVRYPGYDYLYHVYHLRVQEKPQLRINAEEHKDYRWLTPAEALKLPLIEDEDTCIKWSYGLE